MNKTIEKSNTVTNKEILFSHISQKQITDKSTGRTTEFVVMFDSKFENNDWLSKTKLMDIVSKLGDKPLEYPLKKTLKGNPDEGRAVQSGKVLRITLGEDNVTVDVYTQVYGESWKLIKTHTISKTIFDAYVLVVKNDIAVVEAEKENKASENFSLNLG